MQFGNYYQSLILKKPAYVLLLVGMLTIVAAYYSLGFQLDASSESLVLENDKSLNYYRQTRENYGTDEFLVVTYTPHSELLSDESLSGLRSLRDQFLKLENVETVNSILDAPIIYNANVRLSEMGDNLDSLESGLIDRDMAMREFLSNPFYQELLVSKDARTTALQIIFKFDERQYDLFNQRQDLNNLTLVRPLDAGESAELERLNLEIKLRNKETLASRSEDVRKVREIMDSERIKADMFLGGLPMIVSDMIDYIRSDLIVFGVGVLVFLIIILTIFFHQMRWVLLPLLCCSVTAMLIFGFLGAAGWQVTVISSNFMSILLIITLSLTVHLIVRFRDLQIERPELSHLELTGETVASMAKPCFFTILTTVVAFASLIVSDIRPVIDFGWIMIIGLCMTFITSFLLFPSVLSLMAPARTPPERDYTRIFTLWLSRRVQKTPWLIVFTGLFISIVIGIGMSRLKVENRFIDNFKSSTEIYQGMIVIDKELGGTTPLEVIIDPDDEYFKVDTDTVDGGGDLDSLLMEFATEQQQTSYWLNPTMMDIVKDIQEYLDANPVIGKVLSIGTVVRIAERLNDGELDAFDLAIINKRVPEQIREELISPYLSEDTNQVRFSARVIESDASLNRRQLLDDINNYLVNELNLQPGQFHLTGMLVLYNNMLQSLFRSQILTLGAVLVAIFLTFIFLFRHFTLAVLGIIPNIFSVVLVLGIMGWLRIPLDMMTITIASITIGIAVDDTIHYIHRFKHEYALNHNHEELISRCHGSIGKAMFYTSAAITFGFCILGLSNFTPTIHFGLLTGIAMLVAIVGNLLLLPALILIVKPVVK